ncbi:MAG: redox-regulated ATPase YchF [Candidatus Aminicenantes bacterium]|nr:redox-regulated ATPase YchF [Candidatus Aminicenantes bacterium]
MNFTLFGYPRTGKTTLFNLLTGARLEVHAYEEGKKEPVLRTCRIPDDRLDRLGELYKEKKKVAAALDLVDLAGISAGEVKTSALLSLLRKADGLVHVVRAFEDEAAAPSRPVDPAGDIRVMEEELAVADFLSLQSRWEKLDKDLRKSKSPEGEKEKALLEKLRAAVEGGAGLRDVELTAAEEKLIRSFAFLSRKPLLHALNAPDKDAARLDDPDGLYGLAPHRGDVLAFCGRAESEIAELEPSEAEAFRDAFGIRRTIRDRFFEAAPRLLDIVFFFTIGKDEVRAWPVRSGSTAQAASGVIHTDIERGFIRAEVVPGPELFRLGSMPAAKEKGALRLEGKEYVVQDGDVIHFRFAP